VTIWAFVSDIHGNLPALQRAEGLAVAQGATRFVCLGDVIGRGEPDRCVEWVRDQADIAIVGNRDLDYLDRVTPALQEVVRGWANEATASQFIVSHGDLRLHRVLNSGAERDAFHRVAAYVAEQGARVWLFGHTHRARAWQVSVDGPAIGCNGDVLEIGSDHAFVVNVGTTDLPLPGRGPASFATYDDARQVIRRTELAREPGQSLWRGLEKRVDRQSTGMK